MTKISNISTTRIDMLACEESASRLSSEELLFEYTSDSNYDTYNFPKSPFVSSNLDFNKYTDAMGIRRYKPSVLKNDNDAIMAAKDHLIDLLKYYEGDRYYYYEGVNIPYKDGVGKLTSGFGTLTNSRASITNDKAYERMLNILAEKTKEVERALAKVDIKDEDLPDSVKEALIDLAYNKGSDEIDNTEALWAISRAVYDGKWEGLMSILIHLDTTAEKTPPNVKAGLYRRSLSRMILATRDMVALDNKQQKIKDEVTYFYKRAKKYHENNGIKTTDLDKIYQSFAEDQITTPPVSSEGSKHKVLKGESYSSIAQKYCPMGQSVSDFAAYLKRINYNASLQVGNYLTIPLNYKNQRSANIKPPVKVTVAQAQPEETKSQKTPYNCVEKTFSENMTYYSFVKTLLPKDKHTGKYMKPCIATILKANNIPVKYGNDGYPQVSQIDVGSTLYIPKTFEVAGEIISLVTASEPEPEVVEISESKVKPEQTQATSKKPRADWFRSGTMKLGNNFCKIEDYDKDLVGVGREYLRRRRDLSGNTMATREVFEPTDSGRLDGKTIIVNAGHGFMDENSKGITLDIGARSRNGLPNEYQINYDNAMILIEKLRDMGATVIYLQGKEGRYSEGKALISNELEKFENNADFFISLHVNSSSAKEINDRVEFHYCQGSLEGSNAARIFEEAFDTAYKNESYSRTKGGELQVLKTAESEGLPAVLWEVGFINSSAGRTRLKSPRTMNKYADLVSENIVKYFEESALYASYTVKKGDVLGEIAMKHDTTTVDLMRLNGLKSTEIQVGQVLKVPKS